MHNIGVNKLDNILFISDAASYMTKAAETLKMLFPNLIHIKCLLYLLHNCALKIKANFHMIDNLIASVKAEIVKNLTRKQKFY